MAVRPTSIPPAIIWVAPAKLSGIYEQTQENSVRSTVLSEFLKSKQRRDNTSTRGVNLPKKEHTLLHNSIGPTMAIAQCFALFPLQGVLGASASSLKFSWISFRVLYSFVIFLSVAVMALLGVTRLFSMGVDFFNTVGLIFFISGMLTVVQFTCMARQWPTLATHWSHVESNMGPPPGPPLRRTINRMTTLILGLSLVEHILSIFTHMLRGHKCSPNLGLSEAYFLNAFPEVFTLTSYAHWKGVLIEFVNILSTFAWNFMDLFIIIISIALTQRFQQINYKLKAVRGKFMSESFWRSVREEFLVLTDLLSAVDKVIGKLIMLSFSNNLYFICAQLLNGVSAEYHQALYITYFWFSFLFLLLRTIAVCLYAARIHEESHNPLFVLRAVPSLSYCVEVQRFIDHVSSEVIGLTGMKFFTITRGVVLSVASTIVTYEIVLVQFEDRHDLSSRCDLQR